MFTAAATSATYSVSIIIVLLASISHPESFSKFILIGASPKSASRF
ncbi:hypothetical protein LINGRAHAP2_LOCUS23442 [Linum grandiflorum]